MLSISKIKPIILCTIIPIIVFILWSLINNNNNDLNLKEVPKIYPVTVEVFPVKEEKLLYIKSIQLPPVNFKETPVANQDHIKCMATNIIHEAGGEPYMGQVAVARVVMNRVSHGFASDPCKVIYQRTYRVDPIDDQKRIIRCQFSWTCREQRKIDINSESYKIAEDIAHRVLYNDEWKNNFSTDLLFFHNTSVNPRWPYTEEVRIGNHIFYSKPNKAKNEDTRNTRSR
jgi:spore germination cell wall hydrolase CwlJ-like protein